MAAARARLALPRRQGLRAAAVHVQQGHQRALGDAVGEVLLDNQISVPFTRIAVKDQFAETGTGPQLYEKYGLSHNHIVKAVKVTLNKK